MSDNPYRRLYPPQEALIFDGGLDNKFEKALLPTNESPDCLNVEFNNGGVATRQGGVKLNTVAAGTHAFDGLYTRRGSDGSSESLCAFIDGHMLVLGVTTFNTIPSAQSVFTIGQRVGAELSENYLFIGNGGVGPYKYDGLLFTQHGVSAPVQTCTVASNTTGSLNSNGQYTYRVTHVNTALVQSDMGPATATWTVSTAARAILVTAIPLSTAPSQGINARYLYRTLDAGSSYFRVTALNNNTATTYLDVIADANLGSPAPTDNGVPPKYNVILYHRNILFVNDASNPNYVWYSVAGQPYTFASTNFFKVGDKAGDLVKGFAAYDNGVVVFCENSTWLNYMPDPATSSGWRQIRLNSPYGSRSPYCALPCNVRGENVVLHPAVQNRKFVGFAALKGQTLDASVSFQAVTNAGSDLQSQVIEPDMFLIQDGYLNNVTGIVFKNRAFISVTYGASQTTNNRLYVWDFSITNVKKDQPASWAPWSGTPVNITQFAIYSGNLYGASSGTNGFVYRLVDTGVYNDDGSAINSYWWSKEYPGYDEDIALTKDFRYLNFLYDNAGSYFMNLVYRTDSDLGTGTSIQVNLASTATVWGSGVNGLVWGTSTWGGGVAQTESRIYFGGSVRGKRLQFRFDNQNKVDQRFGVHRGQFLYNIRGYR